MTTRRVTIHDVAENAGVSYQTVSRVLNDRPDVAESTRLRVLQAIHQLGYRPSAVARSLATQRTHLLGLVTIDYEDPFYAGVASGVQNAVQKYGWMLVITSNARNRTLEQEYVRRLRERQVEGMVVIRDSFLKQDGVVYEPLEDVDIPLVVVCQSYLSGDFPCLDIDNIDGACQATRHLLDAGHRQIAMITAPSNYQVTHDRTSGFIQALNECSVQLNPDLIVEGDWLIEDGYRACQVLLSRNLPFTAIFCQNDYMAIGAMHALREAGKRVPDDISLVGYDDLLISAHLDPPLTSVWQPKLELGAMAVNLVMERIEHKQSVQPGVHLLKPHLVVRSSVKGAQIDHSIQGSNEYHPLKVGEENIAL
jgi:LacI family transcriptional regulator